METAGGKPQPPAPTATPAKPGKPGARSGEGARSVLEQIIAQEQASQRDHQPGLAPPPRKPA